MNQGIFLTGSTGFLGSYALARLLRTTDLPIYALVRAKGPDHAVERLWEALQFHLQDEDEFWNVLPRIVPLTGSLHDRDLGLSPATHDQIVAECDSVLHIAASLNRKSSKSCFNTNLRGSLYVEKLAQRMDREGTLARFTNVSTAAVAGDRHDQVVPEDDAIDWDRSDYDPYARTKKFAEILLRESLPEGKVLTLRPSTVMGDSRHDRCWITDMVQATVGLSDLPLVPLDPDTRQDIVPGDWVGHGIATLHTTPDLPHDIYHLSAGTGSPTGRSISHALERVHGKLRFAPQLKGPFHLAMRGLNRLPRSPAQRVGAIMKVFWPYITNNVVFDNARAAKVLGPPPPFERIVGGMVQYAKHVKMRNVRVPLARRRAA